MVKKIKIEKYIKVGKYIFLFVSILMLCFFMYKYSELLLDSDDASEMILSKILSEEGGILSKAWYYSTELRVLNNQVIWSGLFRVFDNWNWNQIRLLGSFIIYGCMLLVLFVFCKCYQLQRWFPFLGAIFFLPTSDTYTYVILRSLYYIPHIMILLMLLSFMSCYNKNINTLIKIFVLVIASVLSVLAGMGGLRLFLIYYIPVLLAQIILCCIKRYNKKKWKQKLIFSMCTTIAAVIGYGLNSIVLAQEYSYKSYETISFTYIDINRIINVINGFLSNLGYVTGELFSTTSIRNCVCAIIIFLACYSAFKIIKYHTDYDDNSVLFVIYVLLAMICMVIIYSITDMFYNDRYSTPITALVVFIIFVYFESVYEKKVSLRKEKGTTKIEKINIFIGCFVCIYFISGLSFYKNFVNQNIDNINANNERKKIVNLLQKEQYYNGYASFWNANILTELSDGTIELWSWESRTVPGKEMNIDKIYQWLQKKSHVTEKPDGKIFILMSTEENERSDITQSMTKENILYQSERFIIYGFDSYEKLRYQTATFVYYPENNEYITKGQDLGNFRVLYPGGKSGGPYRQMPKGKYHVTISGQNLNNVNVSCAFSSGKELLPITNLSITNNCIVYNVYLDSRREDVEFCVENQDSKNIIIEKIQVECLGEGE